MRKLSRDEMKQIVAGAKVSDSCEDCIVFCHRNVDNTYGKGKCSSKKDPAACKNYCCEDRDNPYWCS